MTAHGDIFHQTYKFDDDATSGLDTTYTAGPGSHYLSLDSIGQYIATRWLQEEEKSVESLDSGGEWPLQKCEVTHSYQGDYGLRGGAGQKCFGHFSTHSFHFSFIWLV